MTFDNIVSDVCGRCNRTTAAAIARVGERVNRRYRRVTAAIGMTDFRRTTSNFDVTPMTRLQTITGVERVIAIHDNTQGEGVLPPLDELSYDEMREVVPTTGAPTAFAVKRIDAHQVTLMFDSTMDAGYSLSVDAEEAASTLSGSTEPGFNESYHDILYYGAVADELRKDGKTVEARDAENDFSRILSELRLHIALKGYQTIVQGKRGLSGGGVGGSGGGGSASSGTVTHSVGALSAHAVIVGNGGADARTLTDLGTSTKVLHGAAAGDPTWSAVVEGDFGFVDVTTADVSITKHGLAPKLPNDATKFLNGVGAYAVPSDASKAPLASPALTGTPTAPTAGANTNTTQLATTAFVEQELQTSVITLTGKRITSRVTTIVSSATPTINTDNCDAVTITALGAAITSMTTNLSGTPTNFQKLLIRIKDDGTGRAITWGASFIAKGTALPTTTVASKLLTVGFIYDTVAATWGCIGSAQEA